MAYQVFNGTQSIVQSEINTFICNYSENHIYNQVLSIPYFKQKLIAKILNQIPNRHLVINEETHFCDDTTFCIGILEEQLLIKSKIIANIDDFLKLENINTLNLRNWHQKEALQQVDDQAELDWWIRFETLNPSIIYFFGPFDSFHEAQSNCDGYLEDLKDENPEKINFNFQIDDPQALTIVNDLDYLQKENNTLWEQFWQYESEKKYYRDLFLYAPNGYLILDGNGEIKSANYTMLKMLKMEEEEIIGKFFGLFLTEKNMEKLGTHFKLLREKSDEIDSSPLFSLELILNDNSTITVSLKIAKINDIENNSIEWCLSIHDISKLQEIQNQLYHESRHDSLTNLPNRRFLLEFLENILKQEEETFKKFAVLYLDLNKFKLINDNYGHEIGDEVLIILAKRLLTCIRSCDCVARISGDEFMVVLTNIKSSQDPKDCAIRIHQSLSFPFNTKKEKLSLSTSIGILMGNTKTSSLPNILSKADIAMYKAKRMVEPYAYAMYFC